MDKEITKGIPQELPEDRPKPTEVPDKAPTQGELVLTELKEINKMLGAINQNITTMMKPIVDDIEMIKIGIKGIRKLGHPDAVNAPDSPKQYTPPDSTPDF